MPRSPVSARSDHPQGILILFVPTTENYEGCSDESVHPVACCFVIGVTAIVRLWDGEGTVVAQTAKGFKISRSQLHLQTRLVVAPTRGLPFHWLEGRTVLHDRLTRGSVQASCGTVTRCRLLSARVRSANQPRQWRCRPGNSPKSRRYQGLPCRALVVLPKLAARSYAPPSLSVFALFVAC